MSTPDRLPSTSAIADVLALRGSDGWLTPPLQPVVAAGTTVFGRASTVRIERRDTGANWAPMYDVLSADHTGEVLVIAGATAIPGAIWGEILATAAGNAGFVGVALDGTARDITTLGAHGLPLCAAATGIAGPQGTAHLAAVGEPVNIGGVQIEGGDLIAIDDGGCVRIPAAGAATIIADALAYEDGEAEVLAALTRGEPLTSAYVHKSNVVARLRR